MNQELGKPHLSREFIDYHAIGMIKALQKEGYTAYLVGGCVRDLLAGHIPKDFDISTTALPQQIKKILRFSFIIGKRFRLVLVKREDKQYEIATFRREPKEGEFPEGVPFGDNIFGTEEEDAQRRDFTCNAVFYDPIAEKIIDYVNGQHDIERHLISMIGDPKLRLAEDPIRIFRALRFAHKLHFRIQPQLREQMSAFAEHLNLSVLPRRREEFLKLLRLTDPAHAFQEGYDLGLWRAVLPEIHQLYERHEQVDFFEERLRRLPSRLLNPSDTPLLMGTLVLGWLRAAYHHPSDDVLKPSHVEGDRLHTLTKEFLGLHNWEAALINQALSLHQTLADPSEFKKRGHRRKNALLFSDAFPLAVDLAHIDAVLDPEILEFWDAQLESALEELENNPAGRWRPRRT